MAIRKPLVVIGGDVSELPAGDALPVALADVTGLPAALDGKQAAAGNLTALAGLTLAANKLPYATGAGALALADLSAYMRGLLATADLATLKTALSLAIADVTGLQAALDGKQATLTKGAGADIRTGTDDAKYLTAKSLADAMAYAALTDAATVAVDMGAGLNFSLTLAGNRTLGAPSNAKPGQSGVIIVKQDATGSRTLAYNSAWKFAGGAPTLSTAANAVDMIAYVVETTSIVRATLSKAFA